ncbi:hypothetical protein [Novosphingobium sp. Chol11]|nr:hypothetical protein [Novosphingobium sp. Chol11]
MKLLSNDLFRSLALGFLLGTIGIVAASATGPAEAGAVAQIHANTETK